MQSPSVKESLEFFSAQLSERSRTICFGGLALAWGFYVGSPDQAKRLFDSPQLLPLVSVFVAALLLDFIQYLIGFFNSRYLGLNNYMIVLQEMVFYFKLIFTLIGASYLLWLCLSSFV